MGVACCLLRDAPDSACSWLYHQPLTLILCTHMQHLHSIASSPWSLGSGFTLWAALALLPSWLSSFILCHVLDIIHTLFVSQFYYPNALLLHRSFSPFPHIKHNEYICICICVCLSVHIIKTLWPFPQAYMKCMDCFE